METGKKGQRQSKKRSMKSRLKNLHQKKVKEIKKQLSENKAMIIEDLIPYSG